MKKYIAFGLMFLLMGCSAAPSPSNGSITTGLTVISTIVPVTETISAIDARPAIWYWNENWDYCIINGVRKDDIQFTYSSLGMIYIQSGIMYYEKDLDVSYCQLVLPTDIG
jgi:hypothetical protein